MSQEPRQQVEWWTPEFAGAAREAQRLWGPNARVWASFDASFSYPEDFYIGLFVEREGERRLLWQQKASSFAAAFKEALRLHPAHQQEEDRSVPILRAAIVGSR